VTPLFIYDNENSHIGLQQQQSTECL